MIADVEKLQFFFSLPNAALLLFVSTISPHCGTHTQDNGLFTVGLVSVSLCARRRRALQTKGRFLCFCSGHWTHLHDLFPSYNLSLVPSELRSSLKPLSRAVLRLNNALQHFDSSGNTSLIIYFSCSDWIIISWLFLAPSSQFFPDFVPQKYPVNMFASLADLCSRWHRHLESVSGPGWLQSSVCLLYCSPGCQHVWFSSGHCQWLWLKWALGTVLF